MPDVYVRKAGVADATIIADLSRQTFYEAFSGVNTPENMEQFMRETFARESLIDEVKNKNHLYFLAYRQTKIAGYIMLRNGDSYPEFEGQSSIELARIYTVADEIGKGVGRKLMLQALEIAGQLNRQIIWLGVWQHNSKAIKFYESFGYKKFGEHDFILGSDTQSDWLMKRKI